MTERSFERLAPVVIPAAYEHVVERIRRMITLGEVLPGERLPSERSLAEAFQVSRVTVREAIRTLQGEGFLQSRRGNAGGAVVLDSRQTPEESRVRLRAQYDLMRENHEFRLAVEPMAARLAAERRSDEDIQRMEEFNSRIMRSESISEFRQADSGFHLSIAEASGNTRLRLAIEDARSALFFTLDTQEYEVLQATSAQDHIHVIEAIAARNAALATRVMEKHIHDAWQEIVAVIEGAGRE